MIDYIKPKTRFSFFLNQVVLPFSILFFSSSCFEGVIKDKSKKNNTCNKPIVMKKLNNNNNDFVDYSDKGIAKLRGKVLADYFKKHDENKNKNLEKSKGQSPLNIEKSKCIGKEVEVRSLSEKEREDLQKAIKESIKRAEIEEQKRKEALYINSVREGLNELKRKGINREHVAYIKNFLQKYRTSSNQKNKIDIKRMMDDYIDVIKQDAEILPPLAMLQVHTRASRPLVMSKKELIKKLKEKFGDPVNMREDCLICCSDTPSDLGDPLDFYRLPCCGNNIVVHIACIARSAIKKYYDIAGDPKCGNPKYECAFCRQSLL